VRLLSVSIDPLGDTPQALSNWLAQFGARSNWLAVRPDAADVERLSNVLNSGGEVVDRRSDVHSGQVFIVNTRGQLVFRTASMPPVATILDALELVARA
jgi:protein SCO1/2